MPTSRGLPPRTVDHAAQGLKVASTSGLTMKSSAHTSLEHRALSEVAGIASPAVGERPVPFSRFIKAIQLR